MQQFFINSKIFAFIALKTILLVNKTKETPHGRLS
jgi:hypothetical protein